MLILGLEVLVLWILLLMTHVDSLRARVAIYGHGLQRALSVAGGKMRRSSWHNKSHAMTLQEANPTLIAITRLAIVRAAARPQPLHVTLSLWSHTRNMNNYQRPFVSQGSTVHHLADMCQINVSHCQHSYLLWWAFLCSFANSGAPPSFSSHYINTARS